MNESHERKWTNYESNSNWWNVATSAEWKKKCKLKSRDVTIRLGVATILFIWFEKIICICQFTLLVPLEKQNVILIALPVILNLFILYKSKLPSVPTLARIKKGLAYDIEAAFFSLNMLYDKVATFMKDKIKTKYFYLMKA